jgi:hypothetical protein
MGRGVKEPQPWIIEKIVAMLMKETTLLLHQTPPREKEGSVTAYPILTAHLNNELMDLLECEYF